MLTGIQIRNFKRFEDADIELGQAAVLIGPNNSGKTTALQGLVLWDIGLRRWNEKRKGKSSPEKRPGVTVNRRDLAAIPVPVANLLWRNLHVRNVSRTDPEDASSTKTENVRVDIIVRGVTHGVAWLCGLEFDYANEESFYCRPLRMDAGGKNRMPIPEAAGASRVAFLPPMSGLADREYVKQTGEIGVLIGQGQTAQVLRNLLYRLHNDEDNSAWHQLVGQARDLFGVELLAPQYVAERSEITVAYKDRQKNTLDLSCAGRGLQQTLLLLAHLYSNPGSTLLLDEPDAHLEVLRQRQTYNLLIQIAEKQGSQIIAASHSEVVLNEAAGRDTVIAFVGKPHRIDDRPSQVLKALRDIGFEHYYQAEETGWILFLENSTDLSILQTFARLLDHEAQHFLARPYVKYIETNLPQKARDHFHGLKEAKDDLVGIAVFDRLDQSLQLKGALIETTWRKREIENYFCTEAILLAYARMGSAEDLFTHAESQERQLAMQQSIEDVTRFLRLDDKDPWSPDVKASDDVLDRIFKAFSIRLGLPVQLRKSDYYVLAELMDRDTMDPEIGQKLDAIVAVAKSAKPRRG